MRCGVVNHFLSLYQIQRNHNERLQDKQLTINYLQDSCGVVKNGDKKSVCVQLK